MNMFQKQVADWMEAAFADAVSPETGEPIDVINSMEERNMRFLEEALELVQSTGFTRAKAHHMVDYVFDRNPGEVNQEVGGVEVTLAALSNTRKIDRTLAASRELSRIWDKIERIRAKHAAKPSAVRATY